MRKNTKKEKKGATTGYLASKRTKTDGLPFMIKTAYRDSEIIENGEKRARNRINSANLDATSLINEYIAAPLYKRTLYNRTPLIERVENDIGSKDKVCIRSKFLQDFVTLDEFKHYMPKQFKKHMLSKVTGAEKLFASVLLFGEGDMHGSNIGVMQEKGKNVFAKIDHGLSVTQWYADVKTPLEWLSKCLQEDLEELISLNINLFKEAIDQALMNLSRDELRNIIGNRIDELKKSGIEIDKLGFYSWGSNQTTVYFSVDSVKLKSGEVAMLGNKTNDELTEEERKLKHNAFYDKLEERYVAMLENQMKVMDDISKRLDIIARIKVSDNPKKQLEWINGNWLVSIKGDDPLDWLLNNQDPNIKLLNADLIEELESASKLMPG